MSKIMTFEQKALIRARVRQLWNESGLLQKEFGKSIGVNKTMINHFFAAKTNLGVQPLVNCARKYAVSTDWLLGITDVRSPAPRLVPIESLETVANRMLEGA